MDGNDYIRHAPGLGGAFIAALLKLKDGWRVMLTQFVMGSVPILVLQSAIEWGAKKTEVPSELVAFAVGGLGVAFVTKMIETVQALEFAKPFNARIERWTGAKAPVEQSPGAQP